MIWNNKGGVGKTFLSYSLSVEYAISHPEEIVVVADMCPQANVSEILLGGNGKGEANLQKCFEEDRTIASYIKARYDKSQFGRIGNELSYFVNVKDYNSYMPDNLFLIPGDIDLDLCATIINYLAQAPQKGAWLKSRSFLNDLIDSFISSYKNKKVTCFIDCNPSFANYTEMAVLASSRIITPCTADAASIRGIKNLFRMIYGIRIDNNSPEISAFDTFASKIKDAGIQAPKLHLFLLNKSRVLDKSAAKAFTAHINKIEVLANDLKVKYPNDFTTEDNHLVLNIKDGNTLAAIINHTGLPLSKIQHKTYTIYGKRTQANQSQIDPLLSDIHTCVNII